MICDTYTIWICPHCEYWAADHEHEDIYNPVHLSIHAGCDQPFAPLTGIVCKPIDGAIPDQPDVENGDLTAAQANDLHATFVENYVQNEQAQQHTWNQPVYLNTNFTTNLQWEPATTDIPAIPNAPDEITFMPQHNNDDED